jgi:hypothetical protein
LLEDLINFLHDVRRKKLRHCQVNTHQQIFVVVEFFLPGLGLLACDQKNFTANGDDKPGFFGKRDEV